MIASSRKEKIFRLPRDLVAEFEKLCTLLALSEREAAEVAIRNWVKANRNEAQKKLDLYAEKGITIIEPQTVNIAIFQRAEILLAKEELQRVIENLRRGNPEYHHELQLEMAKALKWIQPIYAKTKDPELLQLLQKVAEHLN
jgi:hypothetical protein